MNKKQILFLVLTLLTTADALAKEVECQLALQVAANPASTLQRGHVIYAPDRGGRKIQLAPDSLLLQTKKINTLSDYLNALPQEIALELISDIENLKNYNRVADFSAGNLSAIKELLELKPKLYGFASMYKPGFIPSKEDPRLTTINRQFERLVPREVPEYDLAFDMHGAFSTTKHLDYYLKLAVNRLEVGGKLYIQADFSKLQIKSNPAVLLKKYGYIPERTALSFREWMASNEGITYKFSADYRTLVITRTSDKPFIVSTMDNIEYQINGDGSVTRMFQEVR